VIHPDQLHQLADGRAEADAVCGAEYGVCSEARRNARNGYQHRDFDARTGSLNVAIPMVRQGTCFLDRRIRAECASHP
jgi:transposase-like protein